VAAERDGHRSGGRALRSVLSEDEELGLILLSHGGEEKAVEAEEDQKLGNPLLLRRPLELGVKVISSPTVPASATTKTSTIPGENASPTLIVSAFDGRKRYEGLLFADISAMTQYNRAGRPLMTIMGREDLHDRLVNGSDYPLPAINVFDQDQHAPEAGIPYRR